MTASASPSDPTELIAADPAGSTTESDPSATQPAGRRPKKAPRALSFLPVNLAIISVLFDQWTKFLVTKHLVYQQDVIEIIPDFFRLVHIRNTGAAFGMLSKHTFVLSFVSLFMLILIVIFRREFNEDRLIHRIAFGLLIGGIIGNLIDRFKMSYVVDFLDVYIGRSHWPAFNIADSCICIAVTIYIITSFFTTESAPEKKSASADATSSKASSAQDPSA